MIMTEKKEPISLKVGELTNRDEFGRGIVRIDTKVMKELGLEEEKKALSDDIREIYSEAKGAGFDIKVLRQIIGLRKMDSRDRDEMEQAS